MGGGVGTWGEAVRKGGTVQCLSLKHSFENQGCAVLAARAFVGNAVVRHRRPRHSLENQGRAMLLAEPSADHRGRAAPVAEVFN